ncbi:type IV toxin-antitoxin system AbiEi family antitoxin domain-containing protein [Microbacterium sp. cx-59]|uniref:type IV toxin-antitoxin system AbiEi family antitoxin domain-containing protein n=1 Tax=Microbacterium sp. cx-59 TaxID=2891207 RepID=UPI001E5A7F02|nr:type IV toxin-antitoxin system AbiEi family antitoxin domain-containing protein [Microbacterium sp. cx-59]MCC4907872.1 type IV toxin-antitoxin system AbiEi family antitoxin domain-containing protein [Microbacterium sp. cx-59]
MSPAWTVELFRRDDLADVGIGAVPLRRLLAANELTVVRPGVYLRQNAASAFTAEDRIIVRARAVALVSHRPPVFSHLTAAALHGLPVYGVRDRNVHTIVPDSRPRAPQGVVRHRGALDEGDIVERVGLRCTSLVRTVADVARTSERETSVCVADAALRLVAMSRTYDADRAQELRAAAAGIARGSAHGIWRAERVLEFADGRAQLPGESISRIRLAQLGFARPDLQVRVAGPHGQYFFVDFGLDDVHALGEFDGLGKYTNPDVRSGRDLERTLLEEKAREDWIRGTTGRPLARWGWDHIGSAQSLGTRLAAFGLVPPRSR